MKEQKTIALYIRVSHKERENNSGSILNQKKLLYQYIDSQEDLKENHVIEKIDDGYTGLNFNRPAFLDLLLLARQQAIQCIVVKDLSRIGRNYIEVNDAVRYLISDAHIRLISVNDRYDSEQCTGFAADPQEGIVNLMYDLYSRDLSDKVKTVIRKKQKMGEYKVAYPFYGYQFDASGKLIKNEETAKVVFDIFDMYVCGKRKSEIARVQNDRGIPSPEEYAYQKYGRRKKHRESSSLWTAGIIDRILGDERYTGVMIRHRFEVLGVRGRLKRVPKENWIRSENNHEPIVSKELFLKIQGEAKQKSEEKKHVKSIYVCGHCGHVLAAKKREGVFVCRYGSYQTKNQCQDVKLSTHIVDTAVNIVMKQLIEQSNDGVKEIIDCKIKQWNCCYEETNRMIEDKKNKKYGNYEAYVEKRRTKEDYMFLKSKYDDEIESLHERQKEYFDKIKEVDQALRAMQYQKNVWIQQVKIYGDMRIEILLTCKK